MTKQTNNEVREALKKSNLSQWQLAELLGVSENTVYRKLRTELPADQKKEILDLIEKEYQGNRS